MSKGFSQPNAPKNKSLRQKVARALRIVNRRGNRRKPAPLSESATIQVTPSQLQEIKGVFETSTVGSLEEHHWQELQKSCIDPELAALNFKSLNREDPYEYLLYSQKISRRNDGRLRDGDMRRYAHLERGGWWCSGVDPQTGEGMEWGGFKPDQPYIDEDGKPVKYEQPPKTNTQAFFLKMPAHLWKLVARRYDVPLPEILEPRLFWQWVKLHKLSIIITEGVKKCAALLSLGYIAVAIPGINSGYRCPRNEHREKIGKPALIPELAFFADGRDIYLGFDQDIKRKTIRNVNQALGVLSRLFGAYGCKVKVLKWLPQLGKGVDDFIFNGGNFDEIYRNAQTIQEWETKQLRRLTYTPDLELNQRFLGEIDIPRDRSLICLKSPKNTGKSFFLKWITDPIIRSGVKRVLGITHRVQLGTQLAENLGLPFITEVNNTPEGSAFGMFLCIDSLRPNSQAKFNPDDWKGCWLILDEVQQLIWHLLSSTTCQKERVLIIKTFKQLLINVVTHGGKIFIADADLNDISIDFIESLIGFEISKFIVENTYKFQDKWQVNVFNGSNPSGLVNHLESKLAKGEKHFVCLSGQKAKSRWGSKNLERYFQKKFPDLRILRFDSETVADKNHPAFGCVGKINEVLKQGNYDLVLTTPVIETGISIENRPEDIYGVHFDGVWGIFQGVQTTDSVRQHLSRYRVPVARYIWLKEVGINRVGNGSCYVKGLLAGEHKKSKCNIQLLLSAGFEESLDGKFEPTCLTTWAKMGAIINSGMAKYGAQVLADLASEGHIINLGFELIDESKELLQSLPKNLELFALRSILNFYLTPKAATLAAMVDSVVNAQSLNISLFYIDCLSIIFDAFIYDCQKNLLPTKEESEETKQEIDDSCKEGYLEYREAVANEESIDDAKFERLDKQQSKTQKELLEYRKGQLERKYNIPVTADLVEKDDNKWYSKIRLHYYFGKGREFLPDREKGVMSSALRNGDGDYFIPDINKSMIGSKVLFLENSLFFRELLDATTINNSSPLAIKVFESIQEKSQAIKLILGIDLSAHKTPMTAIQAIVGLIGYRFPRLKREGKRGEQQWLYGKAAADFVKDDEGKILVKDGQAVAIPDGREDVFVAWVDRDIKVREKMIQAALEAEKMREEMNQVIQESEVIENNLSVISQQSPITNNQSLITNELTLVDTAINEAYPLAPVDSIGVELAWKRRLERALIMGDNIARSIYQLACDSGVVNSIWQSLNHGVQQSYCRLFPVSC